MIFKKIIVVGFVSALAGCVAADNKLVKIDNSTVGADLRKIYISYEIDYLSNDAESVGQWLSDDMEISQTLHVPGIGADTLNVTRSQLLSSMQRANNPNTTPKSKYEDVKIVQGGENSFCGESKTSRQVTVNGKRYKENEVRNVCFESENQAYRVIKQEINVYYQEL